MNRARWTVRSGIRSNRTAPITDGSRERPPQLGRGCSSRETSHSMTSITAARAANQLTAPIGTNTVVRWSRSHNVDLQKGGGPGRYEHPFFLTVPPPVGDGEPRVAAHRGRDVVVAGPPVPPTLALAQAATIALDHSRSVTPRISPARQQCGVSALHTLAARPFHVSRETRRRKHRSRRSSCFTRPRARGETADSPRVVVPDSASWRSKGHGLP